MVEEVKKDQNSSEKKKKPQGVGYGGGPKGVGYGGEVVDIYSKQKKPT